MESIMELLLQGLPIRVRLVRTHMQLDLTCTATCLLHNQVNNKDLQEENKKEKMGNLLLYFAARWDRSSK